MNCLGCWIISGVFALAAYVALALNWPPDRRDDPKELSEDGGG